VVDQTRHRFGVRGGGDCRIRGLCHGTTAETGQTLLPKGIPAKICGKTASDLAESPQSEVGAAEADCAMACAFFAGFWLGQTPVFDCAFAFLPQLGS
jgi:hypothetical protein